MLGILQAVIHIVIAHTWQKTDRLQNLPICSSLYILFSWPYTSSWRAFVKWLHDMLCMCACLTVLVWTVRGTSCTRINDHEWHSMCIVSPILFSTWALNCNAYFVTQEADQRVQMCSPYLSLALPIGKWWLTDTEISYGERFFQIQSRSVSSTTVSIFVCTVCRAKTWGDTTVSCDPFTSIPTATVICLSILKVGYCYDTYPEDEWWSTKLVNPCLDL